MTDREPDFTAHADPHDTEYWRQHPDVERLEALGFYTEEEGPYVELSIWLRPGAADAVAGSRETKEPEREADLELGGDGVFPAGDFWTRCPGLEHAQFIEDFMDGWWAVKLWFTDPGSIVRSKGRDGDV